MHICLDQGQNEARLPDIFENLRSDEEFLSKLYKLNISTVNVSPSIFSWTSHFKVLFEDTSLLPFTQLRILEFNSYQIESLIAFLQVFSGYLEKSNISVGQKVLAKYNNRLNPALVR